MLNRKPAITGSICLFLCCFFFVTAAIAITNDAEAINKAGRQRMLSQRIALSYFMIGTNTNETLAAQRTDASIAEFHSNLMELRSYLKNPDISLLLENEAAIWKDYSLLAMSKPNPDQAKLILIQSNQLLDACQKVVKKITTKASAGIPRLIDTAGRQRMLSQRLGKYYFAMMWKISSPRIEENFLETLSEFDRNMAMLSQAPENTAEISAALRRANTDWELSKFAFKQYQSGRYTPFIIATTTESILKAMNDITGQYVALAASKKYAVAQ